MLQTSISFDTPQAAPRGEDRCAFQIGWDHARHGLHLPAILPSALPAEHGPQPLRQGWHAAQAVFGRRIWPARPAVRPGPGSAACSKPPVPTSFVPAGESCATTIWTF